MKKKILFVIDNLQFGGGERVFSQIINGLDPDRYNIFLATLPDGPLYKSITNKHVKYFALDFSKRVNLRLIFQIKKIIKTNGIQIVHGQGTRAEFYARIANKIAGTSKYVSTIAMPVEGFDVGNIRRKIYRLFDRFSERCVDRFIVVSDSLKNKLIHGRGISNEKIVRIYNGIELDKYSPDNIEDSRQIIRGKFNIDDNTYLIGAIGRLVWQKGFEYLINSIPDVIKVHPNVKFIIVGEGPLKKRLKAQSSKLKANDNLILTGFRSDIKDILATIDILVIPSLLEGFPMITLEAMALGKSIIATRIDGIKEQITNNKTGVLVQPGDANTLTRAIVKLLDNKQFAKTLGLNAKKTVESEFSFTKMIADTEKIYKTLLESHIE